MNLLTHQENDFSILENKFINLITNPFIGKEESSNDLIQGETKDE